MKNESGQEVPPSNQPRGNSNNFNDYKGNTYIPPTPSPDSREPQVDSDNPIWVKGYLKGVDDAISKAKIQAAESTPQPPEGIDLKKLQERFDEFFTKEDYESFKEWQQSKPPAPQLPSQSPPVEEEIRDSKFYKSQRDTLIDIMHVIKYNSSRNTLAHYYSSKAISEFIKQEPFTKPEPPHPASSFSRNEVEGFGSFIWNHIDNYTPEPSVIQFLLDQYITSPGYKNRKK